MEEKRDGRQCSEFSIDSSRHIRSPFSDPPSGTNRALLRQGSSPPCPTPPFVAPALPAALSDTPRSLRPVPSERKVKGVGMKGKESGTS